MIGTTTFFAGVGVGLVTAGVINAYYGNIKPGRMTLGLGGLTLLIASLVRPVLAVRELVPVCNGEQPCPRTVVDEENRVWYFFVKDVCMPGTGELVKRLSDYAIACLPTGRAERRPL
jgi:hypothetical protein